MQSDTLEERYAIKFCFKLGKNDATEPYRKLQTAFGPSCMNRASVFEWHKRYKEGFKGDQEEIRSEGASTLQIGSVAFPPEQYTSQQLHPYHKLFDQDWHFYVCHPKISSRSPIFPRELKQ